MDRHQIQFPPKHLALREDVHQLGVLVGEMLREQGGAALYDMVEGDRQAAIARRGEEDAAPAELAQRVAGRPPEMARDLVRAFSTWFQAVNLAVTIAAVALGGALIGIGVMTTELAIISIAGALPAIFGDLFGARCRRHLHPATFKWLTLIMLAVMGAGMLVAPHTTGSHETKTVGPAVTPAT